MWAYEKKSLHINLPSHIKLTWHEGYKKAYPEDGKSYAVIIENKKHPFLSVTDFALFLKETIDGYNLDRWRPLNYSCDIFFRFDRDCKVRIKRWAEMKGETKEE